MHAQIIKGALLLLLFGTPGSVIARTWMVFPNGSGDAPTIQAGIDSSVAGDTVLVGCGTYLEFDIVMKGGIVLRGENGDPTCAVIDADELGRVMICDSLTGDTRIEGLTLSWGVNPPPGGDRNGSGLFIRHSSPLVLNCVFDNNFTSWVDGGGLYCTDASAPLIIGCRFTNNTSGNMGGGMFASDSSLAVLRNCEFEGNFASWWGGGLACAWYSDIIVDSCVFRGNTTNHYGAAFAATNRSLPAVSHTLFLSNDAKSSAGAVVGYKNSIPVFENCIFFDNLSAKASAILARDTSRVYLDKCIVYSNHGSQAADAWGWGSGIFFSCSDVFGNPGGDWVDVIAGQDSINGNLWVNPGFCNPAQEDLTLAADSPCLTAACGPMGFFGEGCAVTPPDLWYIKPDGTGTVPTILEALQQADHGDTLVLADGVFQGPGNRDLDCGGKILTIYSESGDPATCIIDLGGSALEPHSGFYFSAGNYRSGSLRGVTIRNGYAEGSSLSNSGGALHVTSYDFTITDCRFEGNSAVSGGGVYAQPDVFVVSDCWFSGNSASDGGALVVASGDSVLIEDCDFVSNSSIGFYGKAVRIVSTDGLFTRCRVDSNDGGGLNVVAWGDTPDIIDCKFRWNNDSTSAYPGAGISLLFDINQWDKCTVRNCLIEGNTDPAVGGGIYAELIYYDDVNSYFFGLTIDSCTIVNNSASSGAGLYIYSDWARWEVNNTLIAFNRGGEALDVTTGPAPSFSCSVFTCTDVYGNPGGDWTGCVAGLLGLDGNISEDPLFCDAANGDYTLDASSPCLTDLSCGKIGAFGEGCDVVTGMAAGAPGIPANAFLSKNLPNPFNPLTTVRFGLPGPANVTVEVHDIAGRRVATIASGPYRAGTFSALWDGRESNGRPSASGIYFIRMETRDFATTRKIILLR